jgi:hypothetical protein
MKIQDLLANIGGIIKGIMVITILIENYLVHKAFLINISNEIFINYEEDNDNSQTNKSIIKLTNDTLKNSMNNVNQTKSLVHNNFINKNDNSIIKFEAKEQSVPIRRGSTL